MRRLTRRRGAAGGTADQTAAEKQEEQIEKPLIEDVSEDVAPTVQEFIEEAAAANKEGNAAIAEEPVSAAEESAMRAADGTQDAAPAAEEVAPYIAFEGVNKSFGDLVVLKDVSFYVKPGETLCILGRSGVGKSVSLQILMGFLKPDSGTVLVAGQNIAGYTEQEMQEVRRKVTMVFQNGALFDSITRRGECGVPTAGTGGHGGGPDSAGGEGFAGDGGGGGDGKPAAVGAFDGDEAVGGDCAGAGVAALGGAV